MAPSASMVGETTGGWRSDRHFEWVQNLQHLRWEERKVNERLRRTMRKAFREVSERADKDQVSLRTAASRTRGYID